MTITLDESQALIKYHGTGILPRSRDGEWSHQEWITIHPEEIGIVVNDRTGVEVATTTFKIHYGQKGTHIVPDYPSRKGMKSTV